MSLSVILLIDNQERAAVVDGNSHQPSVGTSTSKCNWHYAKHVHV